MPARKKTPKPMSDPTACVALPPGGARGDLLWFDGERLAWLPGPTGEGQILTSGAGGALVWANPGVHDAGPRGAPKNGPPKNGEPSGDQTPCAPE